MFWKRRQFFQYLGAALGGSLLPWNQARAEAAPRTDAPEAPVTPSGGHAPAPFDPRLMGDGVIQEQFDIVVAGGGIAGFCAAVAAARNGARVALVHERSMLGGNSSSEVRLYPENATAHQVWIKECGIFDEIHVEERVRNHIPYREGLMNCHWDLVLYEWVLREPNITLFLNTHMHRAVMKNGAIESIYCIQLGSEREYLLGARIFIDTTGDGVLAHRAGAEYRWGREARDAHNEPLAPDQPDEQIMGSTLFFRAVDTGAPVPFKRPDWAVQFGGEEEFRGRNHSHIEGGYWWLEVGPPYHPIKDNNAIIHEAMRHLLGVWDHIKNGGDHGAENYGLEFVATWPYKRECRRILGDFILTQQHTQDPPLLDDNVAFGVWFIDIHTHGILDRSDTPYKSHYADENWDAKSTRCYGIPLRALYSRNIPNLMMAGRPISCSYVAFSSSRVLCTGAVAGQAAGTAAALCVQHGKTPREIARDHARECQQRILRQDGYIPGVANEDPADLARQATVSATSEAALEFPAPTSELEMALPKAQIFPVSANRVDRVSLLLRSALLDPAEMTVALRRADHVWDFRGVDDLTAATASIPPDHEGWVHFDLNVDVDPGRLYYLHTTAHPGVFWKMFQENDANLRDRCPVGVAPAELPGEVYWRPFREGKSFCMRVAPEIHPFAGQNAVRGSNRPDQWTNLWRSSPDRSLPQSLELAWDREIRFNRAEITFDTNMNRRNRAPFFRYPECVRDYRIEARIAGVWTALHEERDNYQRRRVHDLPRTAADRLRLTVLATNGVPEARVYEVRVYDEA
ncbi:MAG: FAD-dependent oxidoreductase [Candidatus Hydrogenedentes bacterium]|nr:FAD-dependent oxidoreductase [Candidatus Hydrogenedentota bacterium]